jgi:hypothetical protein
VSVAGDEKLKLGKGVAFVKSRLKRLRQGDGVWEVDFRALPKPTTQTETHYLGLVVAQDGRLLADLPVQYTPSVNDLARLLADAMRRPLTEGPHRPQAVHVRRNPRWTDLFPVLAELGIEVVTKNELPKVVAAYDAYLRQLRAARSARAVKPTPAQAQVETLFPNVARWVSGYGHIEVGDQEGFGFVVRAIDYGGLVFEDDTPTALAEAMAALEKGLADYFEQEGID